MNKALRLFIFTLLTTFSFSILAQEKIELSDIVMTNLGDDQMYAHKRNSDKTPLNGKVRIITGFTTEYINADFKGGYGIGKWEYYKENKLTVIVHFKNGYMDGEYKELYSSGDVKETGAFNKGKKQGEWKTLKSDGIIKGTEVFDNGDLVKKITYYTDGKVDSERNFKNGKENGVSKQYTWEGELKSEKNYLNGKQVGKQIQYYSSNQGNFIQTSYYDSNGLLDGEFSEIFAENKAVKTKGYYKKNRKTGKWVYGYKNGPYKEEIYEDGKLVDTIRLNK